MPAAHAIDEVFRALSDPTRRKVVERLNKSPASVSELAEPFDMALPSFVQHLHVLESCGLVCSTKAGRIRTYTLELGPLRQVETWLDRQRKIWEQRLDRFDTYVSNLKEERP